MKFSKSIAQHLLIATLAMGVAACSSGGSSSAPDTPDVEEGADSGGNSEPDDNLADGSGAGEDNDSVDTGDATDGDATDGDATDTSDGSDEDVTDPGSAIGGGGDSGGDASVDTGTDEDGDEETEEPVEDTSVAMQDYMVNPIQIQTGKTLPAELTVNDTTASSEFMVNPFVNSLQ